MTTGIALYRCAHCGSRNVEPYIDGKKVIFPVASMLKQQEPDSYKCPDCGAILDHCMSGTDRETIESGLILGEMTSQSLDCIKKHPHSGLDPAVCNVYEQQSNPQNLPTFSPRKTDDEICGVAY